MQRCRCGGGVQVKVLLTSSPSSLVFSTGFSLSLVRGLVTTRIPPTCARVTLRNSSGSLGKEYPLPPSVRARALP